MAVMSRLQGLFFMWPYSSIFGMFHLSALHPSRWFSTSSSPSEWFTSSPSQAAPSFSSTLPSPWFPLLLVLLHHSWCSPSPPHLVFSSSPTPLGTHFLYSSLSPPCLHLSKGTLTTWTFAVWLHHPIVSTRPTHFFQDLLIKLGSTSSMTPNL